MIVDKIARSANKSARERIVKRRKIMAYSRSLKSIAKWIEIR